MHEILNQRGVMITQGYLNADPISTVRIRTVDSRGYITVKGLTVGASRNEYEYEIPFSDAVEMLELCNTNCIIEKIRYKIANELNLWEIDVFSGNNSGLIIAELELNSAEQLFNIPPWVDVEVTHDIRYYNSNLSLYPYNIWNSI